ncbi:hypothetical protein A2415_02530 [candidate division WWE3 bacterium RIFOXYC1_FULL_39_7]|uniref:Uncharacterized protein n=2 Tax=Katanobacteria TaxID=422282 RepID=A0A1F4X5U6_UNCKA|nr:MAG: hypothetical protein A2415_02530 [candidate division WWE3 bacterium RIFOXYC1_FULL_39_7]OGC77070.1 MAG: hypothetical protein A2619_01600 [candidate division WWE3 bacterium RIFOXYD1_FULL_39_9]
MEITDGWFIVALLEFLALILMTLAAVLATRRKINAAERSIEGTAQAPKEGVIKNVRRMLKVLGEHPVTVFEIHMDDGEIFYAGVDGDSSDLFLTDLRIEFWPASESVGLEDHVQHVRNADGTQTISSVERRYFGLEKFRIIPDIADEPETSEVVLDLDLQLQHGDEPEPESESQSA